VAYRTAVPDTRSRDADLGLASPTASNVYSNSGRSARVTIRPRCGGIPSRTVALRQCDHTRRSGGPMSEAMRPQRGQMPALLVLSGVAIGVVGASVNKHAESVGELVVALGSPTDSSDVAMTVALGHWGLVLLVVGAVVVLAGLVVIALAGRHKQRRCAMDPLRCSTACLTAAPSLPSEPSARASCARAA
jgi:hypothetical protein